MRQSLRYIVTLFLLLITTTVFGQNYNLSMVTLPKDNGLSGNRVIKIIQDKDGFIWLFSLNGIARFDGYEYQWFNKTNSALREIPNPRHIAEDAEGYIWLNQGNKIDLLHHRTFEVIPFEEKFKDIAKEKFTCKNIIQGSDGRVVIELLLKSDKWKRYLYHPQTGIKDLDYLPSKKTQHIYIKENAIWIGTRKEQWKKRDLETGKVLKQLKLDKQLYSTPRIIPSKHHTEDLFSAKRGEEIVIFEAKKRGQIKEIFSFKYEGIIRPSINPFYGYNKDQIVANIGEKLYLIDIRTKQVIAFNTRQNSNNEINRILLIDNNDVIWTKSNLRGVEMFKINASNFSLYAPNSPVRGMVVRDSFLFTNKYKIPLNAPNDLIELGLKKNQAYELTHKNQVWISFENGIKNIYASSGELQKDILHASEINKGTKPVTWAILQDKSGKWWSGTGKGIFTSTTNHPDSLFFYDQYNEFQDLKNATIYQLLEEGDHIWAVTTIGLFYIHKSKGVLKHYALEASEAFRLPVSNIHFLHKDTDGSYWIATNSDGLVYFELNDDRTVKTYKTYDTRDGLSSNILYAILPDDMDRLWISTINGISVLDKKTEQFQAFFEEDGLSQTEFNRISYTKGDDGRIFFGTILGAVGFNPSDFSQSETYNTPINIVQFEKYHSDNNITTDYTSALLKQQKITLEPDDRFFRLKVSMIDYFNSDKIQYYYQIKGLFKDLQPITGNVIELGSLPYGNHELIVKGQGANKKFSEDLLTLPLTVKRPFYLQWWFLLTALGLILLSAYQIYKWRIRQFQERQNRLKLLVAERTAQIQKDKTIIEEQANQLKELDEVKSKFFANISHELRTPLTLILAPLNNLIKSNAFSNKQYTQLLLMQRNGQKLLKRINELLDLSRLDANKLEVNNTPTFMYPFFKTLLATFESAANLKNIQLNFDYRLDEETQLSIDNDKLEKITTNYLSNALKFTPKNGQISLLVKKEEGRLQVSVTDTGQGILEKDLPKIFDRFYQTKKSNQQQGTGIGLSLCQELAKVMKGKVWATSEIDKGSTFYVALPYVETFAVKEIEEKELLEPIINESPKNKAQHKKTVLIVEDNPDLRAFLTIILEEQYNVITAENGQEALERLTVNGERQTDLPPSPPKGESSLVPPFRGLGRLPSLIISDIMMPIMDGIELLTTIKANEDLKHLPVILLTARQNVELKIDAFRIGVDDYLTKPFKAEELLARVDNLIQNVEQRMAQNPMVNQDNANSVTVVDTKWLKEVETIILDNIENNKFTLNQLADELFITSRTLQQKIKGITGKTPKQYQRDIQMHIARQKLKNGDVQTIAELGFQLGFDNPYYFASLYKKYYGVTPKEDMVQ